MTLQHLDKSVTLDARSTSDEMRDFARVLKAALLMIVRYLEKRYCV
jgi:hypothetical protein